MNRRIVTYQKYFDEFWYALDKGVKRKFSYVFSMLKTIDRLPTTFVKSMGEGLDAKVTQSELAQRVGTTKSYISKIENGVIEPSVGLFFRLINALGLRIDITQSMGV